MAPTSADYELGERGLDAFDDDAIEIDGEARGKPFAHAAHRRVVASSTRPTTAESIEVPCTRVRPASIATR